MEQPACTQHSPAPWLALRRDERSYILQHLRSWTGVDEVVRDVLRAVVDKVVHDEYAALAHALFAEPADEYLNGIVAAAAPPRKSRRKRRR